MNYQKVLSGMAIGAAVAGIGFIAFHPGGKKIRTMIADMGCDAADKIINAMRTEVPKMAADVTKKAAEI